MDKHDEMVKMMDERIKVELMMMAVTNPEKAETCQILMIASSMDSTVVITRAFAA